jgi:hypothetical protein
MGSRLGRKGVIVSDMPVPDSRPGAVSRDAVRGLASSWWLFLIVGILWILFGIVAGLRSWKAEQCAQHQRIETGEEST